MWFWSTRKPITLLKGKKNEKNKKLFVTQRNVGKQHKTYPNVYTRTKFFPHYQKNIKIWNEGHKNKIKNLRFV